MKKMMMILKIGVNIDQFISNIIIFKFLNY